MVAHDDGPIVGWLTHRDVLKAYSDGERSGQTVARDVKGMHAFEIAGSMSWEILWALVLGFGLIAAVKQAPLPNSDLAKATAA